MKVLVTGAAGYIGSVLCGLLLEKGHKVFGIDKLLHGGRSVLAYKNHPNFQFIACDISDIKAYESYIDNQTSIVNLAAIVGEPASRKMPEETTLTNVDATRALIKIAQEKKVKKFIFISTCSNYGKVEEGAYATETSELHPLSLYAETKVKMEKFLQDEINKSLNWTILRFSTVFGISPRPRFDLTVNDFTLNALIEKKLLIYLPKSNRPYVHVYDASRAIELILDKPDETNSEIFNVGDNQQNYRKMDIVEEVKKVVDDLEIEYVEKGNDPRDYRVRFDKINEQLNYHTTISIFNGVEEIKEVLLSGILKDYKNKEYYNA